ncbi:hypothetical protein [Kitasatospora viridis]|uniref:Uncharacterized protein n=1 Tax=Kitasatospora viridis TaxID=281105 RepID=A0A561SA72_9ACTN|nr:hypothetical protein [Kitasatospora viridis]TWF71705.1 hypothetical protein FHX73_1876 [Kitasatospora viridis]
MTPADPAPQIPVTLARDTLHHFGYLPGHKVGSFTRPLIAALAAADRRNRAILTEAYPVEAAAVDLAMNHEDGPDRLAEIACVGPAAKKDPHTDRQPPYAEGDTIKVYDRQYGERYFAKVTSVDYTGRLDPWTVGFESVHPVTPNDSRHHVGTLECDHDGASLNILPTLPTDLV